MNEFIEINNIGNDISKLQNTIDVSKTTFNKYLKDEISYETALNIMLSFNNFESSEDFSIESANNDKKSLLEKIMGFIKKIIRLIINAFFTIFNKIKNIYLKLSKRAYEVDTEIRKGQFNYDDSIKVSIINKIQYFNIDKNSEPVENLIKYYENFRSNFKFHKIDIDKMKNIIWEPKDYTYDLKKVVKHFFNMTLLDFGKDNPFLKSINNDHFNVYERSVGESNVLFFNPNDGVITRINYRKKTLKDVMEEANLKNMEGNTYFMDNVNPTNPSAKKKYEEIKFNISSIGQIVNSLTTVEDAIKYIEKKLQEYMTSLPKSIEELINTHSDEMSEESYDYRNNKFNYDNEVVDTVNNTLNNFRTKVVYNLTMNGLFIKELLDLIHNEITKNTETKK